MADPNIRVVTTTIINEVVTITYRFGRLPFNLRTRANAIDPHTIPLMNMNCISLKLRGKFDLVNNLRL